jgi:hypothetical protein
MARWRENTELPPPSLNNFALNPATAWKYIHKPLAERYTQTILQLTIKLRNQIISVHSLEASGRRTNQWLHFSVVEMSRQSERIKERAMAGEDSDESSTGGATVVNDVAALMEVIRQQQAAIQQQNAQLVQFQVDRQAEVLRIQTKEIAEAAAANLVTQSIAAAQAAGGVYGYESGRPLTPEERQFHALVFNLGVNLETVDEVFRQGLTSTDALKRITNDKLKNIIYNISRNKSPMCPDKNKVFLGAAFEDKISVVVAWLKYQRIIGGIATATEWNSNPNANAETAERLQYYQEIEKSKGTEDITLPEPLKEMKKFRDFSEHLITYLRTKRGAANVPLVYVIRDDKTVSSADRAGTVGDTTNDVYDNWDDYSIQCATMTGTHWESDNTSLWQILLTLIRDGPGWDYIQTFEKVGNGDGRGAYLELKAQAYQYTNVRLIIDEATYALRGLRYDGPTRGWNYDKYVRAWLRNVRTLREFNDCPNEQRLVTDFCRQIFDERLDNAIGNVLEQNSPYLNSLEKTQKYLTGQLAVVMNRQSGKKRNVSLMGTNSKGSYNQAPNNREPYTGPIEGKNYPANEWFSMSKKQKETVRKLRQQAAKNRDRRNASSISSDKPDTAEKDAGNQFGANAHKQRKKKRTESQV